MSSSRPTPIKSIRLRNRTMHEMQLHCLSPGTQKDYAKAITNLAKYDWRALH